MSATPGDERQLRERARDAVCWRLAGLLLRRPWPGRIEEIEGLARESGGASFDVAIESARRASEGEYHAWLGPGGPVSPREVSYRPLEDPGKLLAEVAAFHQAFAYHAGSEDPVDHLAVAVDFMGYLALKEAYALAVGHHEHAHTTREAALRFAGRHVRRTARGMIRRFEALEADQGYLPATLRIVIEMCEGAGACDAGDDALEHGPFVRPGLDDSSWDCADRCPLGDGPPSS